MMVSTRGRYALRVIIDIAEHSDGNYIAMKEVAARQGISLKYLEKILPILVKAQIVEGVHGKGGGYKLVKDPKDCRVGDILRLTEGDLSPVACLAPEASACEYHSQCRTVDMWTKLNSIVNEYFDSVTIEDLIRK